MSKLYQCPYSEATVCNMNEPCLGCEDFKPESLVKNIKRKQLFNFGVYLCEKEFGFDTFPMGETVDKYMQLP